MNGRAKTNKRKKNGNYPNCDFLSRFHGGRGRGREATYKVPQTHFLCNEIGKYIFCTVNNKCTISKKLSRSVIICAFVGHSTK